MRIKACATLCAVSVSAIASADVIVTPELVRSYDAGAPAFSTRGNPHAFFSNVDTFTGSVSSNGGAVNLAGNVITRMVVDELTLTGPQTSLTRLMFSVSNLNQSITGARARIRLYADDNGGQPGSLIVGLTSTPMSFGPGSVSLFSVTLPVVAVPGKVWAGILFDNNGGLTGAGASEMNNLGQGIFNPPAVGSSQDMYFRTTTAGSFLSNNPAGTILTGGAGPIGNFAWELIPSPAGVTLLSAAGLWAARRRR